MIGLKKKVLILVTSAIIVASAFTPVTAEVSIDAVYPPTEHRKHGYIIYDDSGADDKAVLLMRADCARRGGEFLECGTICGPDEYTRHGSAETEKQDGTESIPIVLRRESDDCPQVCAYNCLFYSATPLFNSQTQFNLKPREKPTWKPIESDSECASNLAGYGKRSKAICYDMIHHSSRGPLMVVVPAGEGFENSFAIGRYEISVRDYSHYCILSDVCQPISDRERRNEPMTGITLMEAQAYAAWLSERTGQTYRIPTKQEWEYAAFANAKQPEPKFNCGLAAYVDKNDVRGVSSVKVGSSNGWGLRNYIGNIQEWVIDDKGQILAAGGHYGNSEKDCNIDHMVPNDGSSNGYTGIRLVREIP